MSLLHRPGPWTTIRKVALISFVAQLQFYVPVLTPYLQARGLSLAQIASLQSVLLWTQLALEVPTGVIADRLGHRWGYTLALAVQALGQATFLLARDYWAFVLAQVITGAGFAFASGSVDALVYESLPATDRTGAMQRAKGRIGAAFQFGNIAAWIGGGALVADLRLERIGLAIALSILATSVACALTLSLHEPRATEAPVVSSSRLLLRDGVQLFRRNRRLRRIVLVYLLTNAFGAHLLVLYQAYFLRAGVPGVWFGLALGLGSALALFGQRWAYLLVRGLGLRRGLFLATALPGALYLALAATSRPAPAVLLFCLQWGAIQIGAPLFAGYLNGHIPDGARATALSLINAVVSIYVGLLGLIVGRLAEASLPAAFALMGGLVLVGSVAFRIDERHVSAT